MSAKEQAESTDTVLIEWTQVFDGLQIGFLSSDFPCWSGTSVEFAEVDEITGVPYWNTPSIH